MEKPNVRNPISQDTYSTSGQKDQVHEGNQGLFNSNIAETIKKSLGAVIIPLSMSLPTTTDQASHHEREGLPFPMKEATGQQVQNYRDILKKYETVIFSYPAIISQIHYNSSGYEKSVTMVVSVDGKDVLVKSPRQSFNFEIWPEMRIMVDGIYRGRVKQLKFRKIEPLSLDEDDKNLLKKVVSGFETI